MVLEAQNVRLREGQERPSGLPGTIRKIDGRWFGDARFSFEGVKVSFIYFSINEHSFRGVYPQETHPFRELFYTLSGQGLSACNGHIETCSPGHVLVVHPGQAHSASWERVSAEPWVGLLFQFTMDLSDCTSSVAHDLSVAEGMSPFLEYFLCKRNNSAMLDIETHGEVTGITDTLRQDLRKYPEFGSTLIVSFWLNLVMLISKFLLKSDEASGRGVIADLSHKEKTLEKAKCLLSDMANQAMDIPTVAHKVGMSRSHFIRSFHQAYGIPPAHYRKQALMEHAGRMLVQTDIPVGELALNFGFSDASGFSKAFHRYARTSPLMFRARGA